MFKTTSQGCKWRLVDYGLLTVLHGFSIVTLIDGSWLMAQNIPLVQIGGTSLVLCRGVINRLGRLTTNNSMAAISTDNH